jgi:hypothetical protein
MAHTHTSSQEAIPNEIYVPFGNNCAVAYQCSKFGKRLYSLPFDWIVTKDVNKLCDCLVDNFSSFLDPVVLERKNESTNFPLIMDDSPKFDDHINIRTIRIYNKKYGISFVHDFDSSIVIDKSNEQFQKVVEKYNRRIDRFNQLMKDERYHKIVVHVGPKDDNVTHIENIMKSVGYANFTIKMISYSDVPNSSSWKLDEFDWGTFFKSFSQ